MWHVKNSNTEKILVIIKTALKCTFLVPKNYLPSNFNDNTSKIFLGFLEKKSFYTNYYTVIQSTKPVGKYILPFWSCRACSLHNPNPDGVGQLVRPHFCTTLEGASTASWVSLFYLENIFRGAPRRRQLTGEKKLEFSQHPTFTPPLFEEFYVSN